MVSMAALGIPLSNPGTKHEAGITRPALLHFRLATLDGVPVAQFQKRAEEIAYAHLERLPEMADSFIAGKIRLF